MTVRCFLDVSTAHISEQTAEWIFANGEALPIRCMTDEYGWFMHVPSTVDETPHETPPDLAAVFNCARERWCEYVMLDRDAPQIDGLPTFDW